VRQLYTDDEEVLFEAARPILLNGIEPRILGALLDAMSYGLRAMGRLQLAALPRMADFALWITACEPALWPAGTFAREYAANRRAAIDNIIEADPMASRIRAIMANRTIWTGTASDLLLLCSEGARETQLERQQLGKKPPGPCRPSPTGANVPAHSRDRSHVFA